MSVYSDVLQAVVQLANTLSLYAPVTIGALPPDDGISMAWGSGSINSFLDKNAAVVMSAVLNAKSADQQTALDALGQIHTFLSRTTSYPQAEDYQITNVETLSAPSYLGREENSQWLYGSSLQVKFFSKGD